MKNTTFKRLLDQSEIITYTSHTSLTVDEDTGMIDAVYTPEKDELEIILWEGDEQIEPTDRQKKLLWAVVKNHIHQENDEESFGFTEEDYDTITRNNPTL